MTKNAKSGLCDYRKSKSRNRKGRKKIPKKGEWGSDFQRFDLQSSNVKDFLAAEFVGACADTSEEEMRMGSAEHFLAAELKPGDTLD